MITVKFGNSNNNNKNCHCTTVLNQSFFSPLSSNFRSKKPKKNQKKSTRRSEKIINNDEIFLAKNIDEKLKRTELRFFGYNIRYFQHQFYQPE